MNRWIVVAAAITVAVGVVGLLVWGLSFGASLNVGVIMAFTAGAIFAVALDVVRIVLEDERSDLAPIVFNPAAIRAHLAELEAATHHSPNVIDAEFVETWESRPSDIVDEDHGVAVAKLRVLIEREMRRLAFEHQISMTRQFGLMQLARTLIDREILPETLRSALADIISVCNEAVHGAKIDALTARAVISVGEELLTTLTRFRSEQASQRSR